MMLILEQTLYDLGYEQSAKALQKQSGIQYQTQELKLIRSNLESNNFEATIKIIDSLQEKNDKSIQNQKVQQNHNQNQQHREHAKNINQLNMTKLEKSSLIEIKSMVYQTYCMQKIINGEFEAAMTIINEHIQNQTKKQFLCEALVLGNHNMTVSGIQKKKQQIFKFCLSQYQQIGQKQIEKVIESYTSHQGEHNKELKNLLSLGKKFPPMKMLSVEGENQIKHTISHIKVNPLLDQVIAIEQHKDTQTILHYKINNKNWQYQKQISESGHLSLKQKYPIFHLLSTRPIQLIYKTKKQSIESLAFNHQKQFPLIAISSFSIIQILNHSLQIIKQIQAHNKIQKCLYVEFNKINDLLYCCGYYEYLNVFDNCGQQLMSIYPYPKTRKFIFFNNDQIIGISLVTNKIYKHSIDQQVLIKESLLDQGVMPMDLAISGDGFQGNNNTNYRQYLGISSHQYIYVLNPQTFQIIGKTISPTNPNKLIIQIKFYKDFLITLCKNFISYQIISDHISQITQKNNKSKQNTVLINKNKQWLGQGTFDIKNNFMISGLKEIICWQEGNLDFVFDSQSEFEEEMNQNLIIDMEEQDEYMNSDNDDDSNEIDDDSMDDQDQQLQI